MVVRDNDGPEYNIRMCEMRFGVAINIIKINVCRNVDVLDLGRKSKISKKDELDKTKDP